MRTPPPARPNPPVPMTLCSALARPPSLPDLPSPRGALRLALAGAAALAIGLPASAGPTAEELQAEIQRQQELLSRIQQGGVDEVAPPARELPASPLDARAAPEAPALRELPVAIFDEAKVDVPKGHWGNPTKLVLLQRILDADGDGKPELVRFVDPESGLLVRQDEDRDYDGRIDAWSDFEWGDLVRRTTDGNGDGEADAWERYERGRMTERQVDRDYDGVRDGFYSYEANSLALERHDANNDGRIDRTVHYRERRRTKAEEDVDGDGRIDVWYRYAASGDTEVVTRIERDKMGRGRPDIFETFEAAAGSAVLARREEDVDGDGKIDIVSIYRSGKLVRRELAEPDLRPL